MLLLLASSALAGRYFFSDAGIVATGRGGAWIAGANNQFAQYHNPAGLIRVRRPTVNVGWSAVHQDVRFRRLKAEPETDTDLFYEPVENQAKPFSIPQLGFTTPLPGKLGERIVVAVGFISPFAPSSLYPEEGPQRYTIKDTGIYQFGVGPSVAVRLHPMLTLGAGVQWSYLQLTETIDITVNGIDDPTGDIAVEAAVVDPSTLTGNVGLLFDPVEPITLGLSFTPGSTYSARGEGTLDFTGNAFEWLLNEPTYVDDDIALAISLPHVARAGLAVRPVPTLEIEGAVVWQGWSSLEDIEITDIDVTVDTDSFLIPEDQRTVDERIVLPAGLRDTVSLRLGAEWQADERLALRMGGFRETGALADDEVSVALVDTTKWQLGGGASAWTRDKNFRLDLAAAVLLFPDLRVRDSTVDQIDAGVLDDVEPAIVGNGDLSSSGWVLGVQGSWSFGRPAD